MVTQNYTISTVKTATPTKVKMSQYDYGMRTITFAVVDGSGAAVDLTGKTVTVEGTRIDGHAFATTCTVADNEATFVDTVDMTNAAGDHPAELVVRQNDERLGTMNFIVSVEPAAMDEDAEITEEDQSIFGQLYDKLSSGSPNVVSSVSEMTNTFTVYVYVGNETGYENGNWYYYDNSTSTWVSGGRYQAAAADSSLNDRSPNAVQNRIVKAALDELSYTVADNKDAQDEINTAITTALASSPDDAYVEDGVAYFTRNGEVLFSITGIGGGGGGGSASSVVTLKNTSGFNTKTIATGSSCILSFTWSSIEDELETGDGTLTIFVGNSQRSVSTIKQGAHTVDISPYLLTGSSTIKIRVTDTYGVYKTLNFTINTVALALSSSFDAMATYTGDIDFPYIATGAVTKTVHFVLDSTEIGTATVNTSGRQLTYVIPAQTHGAHRFVAYFTAEIDGETVTSNTLTYDIICTVPDTSTVIIASPFNTTETTQYTSLAIPYIVYDPNNLTAQVTLYADGADISGVLTVDRTQQVWTWRASTMGSHTLSIVSGSVSKTFTITVSESSYDIEAETENLSLYLTSFGRSNNEENPGTWTYDDISATFTGFNFASDGWVKDSDSNTVLRVSGDARVTIPYQAFATDFRTGGKTIELEFATSSVRNYDAVIAACLSDGRGFVVTPQRASLYSEQSTISTQFKEDEHVRIAFVVEKRSENRLIYIYINGIMSGTVQYPEDDDFSQTTPVGITLGSNDATLDIYNIRVYDNDLTRYQILSNWVADTQNVDLMINRYERNDVYDDYGRIVIDRLPKDLPYMVISAPVLPQYKGNKLTCSGYFVDPKNSKKDFTFENAQIDVQGTSSQYYARKNYKVKFNGGFVVGGETKSKYAINDDAIPTKTFTFKADVASSEGANNVELARLYDSAIRTIYLTPPQEDDARIREGIDGFPMVIFWDNGNEITFLGKYNFNNDKGTEEVFGFDENDESWEILNNTSNRVLWKSADFSGNDWKNDFEARFPEDSTNITRLKSLAEWLVSTDTSQATGATLTPSVTYGDVEYTIDNADYRLAKFKNELAEHMEVDAVIFNYIFTEIFLMVDNRAKNAFPTYYDNGKWIILPYDYDTAIGTNNEGALAFSYNLEDVDITPTGADVYNGQKSVLWTNLRATFYDEIAAMYQSIRSNGTISYSDTENRFEEHQSKWCEAIFNEDAYFKYLQPLIDGGDGAYLSMLQGSKAEQRKWWLYNRFRYLDSKYNAGDALSDVITLRGYAKSNIVVTPYADIYASVKYGSYLVQTRATRNNSYEMVCPLDEVNDTEIYTYSASQLASIGDISGLKVGYANFAMATKLQSLKIGDADSSYSNANLTELYLGNNTLLQTIDVRNCPHLTQAVDISGCVNIENIYFDGTAITGLTLPNGGIIKVLRLPETITNLTVRNQPSIETFYMPSYANITTLRIENSSPAIDTIGILKAIPANSRVRLIGFSTYVDTEQEVLDFLDYLDTMRGLDEQGNNVEKAQVSGTISIDSITGDTLAEIVRRYPSVTIVYNHISTTLRFYDYDGDKLLYTQTILDGGDGSYSGSTPTRAQTAQYTYAFAGWTKTLGSETVDGNALSAVTTNRDVFAVYTKTVRKYTVKFVRSSADGGGTLQTKNDVAYGTVITAASYYTGATPTTTQGDATDYPFKGWTPASATVQGDTTFTAKFGSPVEVAEITDSWDTIIANIDNGTYSTKYKVGNYKPLDLGTEGTINMQIVAMDADELADGSGYAPLTFIAMSVLNSEYDIGLRGWGQASNDHIRTTILELMPERIRARLLLVNKSSYVSSESILRQKVWIPSSRELGGSVSSEKSGVIYSKIFNSNSPASRIRYKNGTAVGWQTRTNPKMYSNIYVVSKKGALEQKSSTAGYRNLIIGFCLGLEQETITDS